MEFSFGITTNNGNHVKKIIESIYNLNIPKPLFEIVIIGNCNVEESENIKKIPFDENRNRNCLNMKKNLITLNSKYENIVYMHDYVSFEKGWYEGYKKYGNDFDICLNPIFNVNNTRFRDWHLCYTKYDNFNIKNREILLPYEEINSTDFMYINGSYWVAKRKVMEEYPLDEKLKWGQCEDIVWSKIVKYGGNYKFEFNKNSTCKLLKTKNTIYKNMSESFYKNTWKPFITNKERVQKERKKNISQAENNKSSYTRWMNEDQSLMYIKNKKL